MNCCGEPRDAPAAARPINEKSALPTQQPGGPNGHQPTFNQQPPPQPQMHPSQNGGGPQMTQMPQMPQQAAAAPGQYNQYNASPNGFNGGDQFAQQQQQHHQQQPSQQQQYTGSTWNNGNTAQNSTQSSGYTPLLDPSIVRPNPVHAASDAASSIRASVFTPPLSPQLSGNATASFQNGSIYNNPMPMQSMHQTAMTVIPAGSGLPSMPLANTSGLPSTDEGRMSVSLDFGTTFSGVSYGSSRIMSGTVQQILSWPGATENFRKIPTCLLYDEYGQVIAWGLEAKNASPGPGQLRCEW